MVQHGIGNPGTVDLVATRGDECALIIILDGPITPEDLPRLQAKLNNYLSFALDGELYSKYPDTRGNKITIQLDLPEMPKGPVLSFLEKARDICRSSGVALVINVLPR